jgi:hypothetical protein
MLMPLAAMQITEPVLATGIDTTPDALIIELADKRISVPWDKCSPALAAAHGRTAPMCGIVTRRLWRSLAVDR